MPLVAFVLLAIICLALFGFACACLSDHPMQAVDRALSAISALPALINVWPVAVLALFAAARVNLARRFVRAPTEAALQRFLL